MRRILRTTLLRSGLFVLLAAAGCATPREAAVVTPPAPLPAPELAVSYRVVNDSAATDPGLEAAVRPYRERLAELVAERIGEATAELTKGEPEGALGNLVTDAMLEAARRASGGGVDLAVTNNGGLRIPIPRGPITLGLVYELMPFDNALVVLTLTGAQVDSLAQQIARAGGEPVANLSLKIGGERRAMDVRVGGEPLDPERRYRVVTIDYLAGGGGSLTALWEPEAREELGLLLRDVIADHVRRLGTITPAFEGRVTRSEDEAYLRN